MIKQIIMSRMKAVAAFFLTGLVTLLIQSVEQGSGLDIPQSWEDWLRAIVAAGIVALGVHQIPNKQAVK